MELRGAFYLTDAMAPHTPVPQAYGHRHQISTEWCLEFTAEARGGLGGGGVQAGETLLLWLSAVRM